MGNKKKIFIAIGILFTYLLIMISVYGVERVKSKFQHLEIIIAPSTYLKYEDGYWRDAEEDTNKFLGKKYYVYNNHKYLFQGILQFTDDKWYAFDGSNQPLSIPENFFAYSGNSKLALAEFSIDNMNESEMLEAQKVLAEKEITFKPSYTKAWRVSFDLDNDSEIENIYIISNTLGMDEQLEYFSIAYVEDNGNYEILISDISDNLYDVPSLNLNEIIDYDGDNKYEIIFEKLYFDQIGICHQLFKYEKKSYQSVKSCNLLEDEEEVD